MVIILRIIVGIQIPTGNKETGDVKNWNPDSSFIEDNNEGF